MKEIRVDTIPSDQDSGAILTALFSENGSHTRILLNQRAAYALRTPVIFSSNDQELATEFFPEDDDLKATLITCGDRADAIYGGFKSRIQIKNIIVDGQEQLYGRTGAAEPLIFVGGEGSEDITIQDCVLKNTRGWTSLHAFDKGRRVRIINNAIGPSGRPSPPGHWADGCSIASEHSLVSGNTFIDCTDGAIVLFGAPNSLVASNTIIAKTRNLLGGINLVDYGPYQADYTNCRVIGNRIMAENAYVKIGIAIGGYSWGDARIISKGGIVENNSLVKGSFGYGFTVGGCQDFTVRDNHCTEKVSFEGSTDLVPSNPAPCPFLLHSEAKFCTGSFQADFTRSTFKFLIGIQPGLSRQLVFSPNVLKLDSSGHAHIDLKNVILALKAQGTLVVIERTSGKVLWTNNIVDPACQRCLFSFDAFAQPLVVNYDTGQVIWKPLAGFNQAPMAGGVPELIVRDTRPHFEVKDNFGNSLFLSSYTFNIDWKLTSGQYVCMPLDGALQFLWLYLDPVTNSLILHKSKQPATPDAANIVWKSSNWKRKAGNATLILQSDGNLVLYVENEPVWASCTYSPNNAVLSLNIAAHLPPTLLLTTKEGNILWSST